MADRSRSGFTLVELLVVIVIIAMLVGLLLPAVIGARERARQTQCANNQRELATALQQYETSKDHLPGYIDRFSGAGNLSWLVMILEPLGRGDLWTEWRKPDGTLPYAQKRANQAPDIPQLKCPSNSPTTGQTLHYVGNCGIQAGTATLDSQRNPIPEGPAHGVFQNRTVAPPITVSIDRIPDGAQQTLLLSENVHATQWAPPLEPTGTTWTGLVAPQQDWREAHVGMLWWTTELLANYVSQGGLQPRVDKGCYKVNMCLDEEQDPNAPDIILARPSSFHVGGVNVTYADGHQDFLADDIDYKIFQRLMAPDDDKAGL